MGLLDYVRVLQRRWWVVTVALLAGVTGAVLATSSAPPVYQTSFSLFLTQVDGLPDTTLAANIAADRIATYSRLATSEEMLDLATDAAADEADLGDVAVATQSTTSPIFMEVSVTAGSAEGAFALAKAYADLFPDYAADFQGIGSPQAGVEFPLAVFDEPTQPTTPISPDPQRNVTVGLALGLVVGLAGMFVLESSDQRVRTAEQAESVSQLSLLADIPHEDWDGAAPAVSTAGSARGEATRQLRTNVRFAGVDRPLRSLLVTSAGDGEGKTTTAVDLAIASAGAGQRVLLVDADLRDPAVATLLGLPSSPGLTNLLIEDLALHDVVRPWGETSEISVLTSGPIPANPSELLGSDRMRQLTTELERAYDLVIYDTAAVLPVTDALVLAQPLDGVILVARVGVTRRDRLRRAADALRKLDLRVLGVVSQDSRSTADETQVGSSRRLRRARRSRPQRSREQASGSRGGAGPGQGARPLSESHKSGHVSPQ